MHVFLIYIFTCTSLLLSPFILSSLSLFPYSVIGHCRQCKELDNKARAREDYTLYRAMLKTIRKTEENYQDDSHIIFIIQVMDCRGYKGIIGIDFTLSNGCMNLKKRITCI